MPNKQKMSGVYNIIKGPAYNIPALLETMLYNKQPNIRLLLS